MSQDNEKSVTIMRFYDSGKAELAADVLDGEGIKFGLTGANIFEIGYSLGMASQGVCLEVVEADIQKALDVLKAYFESEVSTDFEFCQI